MYKIKFRLKQHTPLIHFQADQAGATLRASELKPKLDRFILGKLGGGDYEKGIVIAKSNGWLMGKEDDPQPALNYRLRIRSANMNEYFLFIPLDITDRPDKNEFKRRNLQLALDNNIFKRISIIGPSPYFANADKIKYKKGSDQIDLDKSDFESIKLGVLSKELIGISITSYFNSIIKEIKEALAEFFLLHNFGTRTSKGFGSFTLEELESQNQQNNNKALIIQKMQFVSVRPQNSIKTLFKTIDHQFKLLKSGYNNPFRPADYKKSEFFQYFVEPPISVRWEKRKIKQKLNKVLPTGIKLKQTKNDPIDFDDSISDYNNYWKDPIGSTYNYRYIRALIGLMENWEFILDNNKKATVKIKHLKSTKEISRFQSPITFKPINGQIYVFCNASYKLIEGEEFEFYYKGKKLDGLKVPTNFDLIDFMKNHFTKSGNFKTI